MGSLTCSGLAVSKGGWLQVTPGSFSERTDEGDGNRGMGWGRDGAPEETVHFTLLLLEVKGSR